MVHPTNAAWVAIIHQRNVVGHLELLLSNRFTLIPVWISTYFHYKVWDEITHSLIMKLLIYSQTSTVQPLKLQGLKLIGCSDNGSTGHQVRCILWEQMAIFNKRIGFFMWIKNLCVEYILWSILTVKSMFDVANMLKKYTVKDVPVNNYEFYI